MSKETKAGGEELDLSKELDRARKRWQRAEDKDRDNRLEGAEDLAFLAGDQWRKEDQALRVDRPVLTINRLPQFCEQITGEMRQMRPSIKTVPVDDRGDPKTAEVIAGIVRYVQNRSNASEAIYPMAADSQVQAGMGHWKVTTEYADTSTFNQELRIAPVDDQLAVRWDPDAVLPDRSDAMFCFEPYDLSRDYFEEKYPDSTASSWEGDDTHQYFSDWLSDDHVRLAVYWWKKPIKRLLALMPDGAIDDLTDEKDPAKRAELEAMGARIEERDGHRVMRGIITASEFVEEPQPWPGRHIPIVPLLGREIRMGRRTFRYGVVRFAKDPQRLYNWSASAQAETIGQQPKTPWLVTDANIANYQDEWDNAANENLPYLRYTPDPANGNKEPTRVQPPVASPGIAQLMIGAAETLHAVTGIYPSSLGAQSNETSGRAIRARQQEGDTTSFIFTKNYGLALKRTAEIIVDLIPHIYDTERTLRVIGEDGKQDIVKVNAPQGLEVDGAVERVMHDVTVGAYDVVFEMGPSYASKAEEAREGMTAIVQAAPDIAPLVLDLIAKAQDWPLADKFAKRMRTLLPPAIQQMEAEEEGDPALAPRPPVEDPNQARLAALEESKIALEELRMKVEAAKADAEFERSGMDLDRARQEFDTHMLQATAPQPAEPVEPAVTPEDVEQIVATIQKLSQAVQEIDAVLEHLVKAQGEAKGEDDTALLDAIGSLREIIAAPTELEMDDEGNPVRSVKRIGGSQPQQITPELPLPAELPVDPALMAAAINPQQTTEQVPTA